MMSKFVSHALIVFLVFIIITTPVLLSQTSDRDKFITLKDNEGKTYNLYKNSYALIIGVSNYTNGWPQLPGVVNDVEVVNNILDKQQFKCTKVMDTDNNQLRKAIDDFINNYGYDPDNRLLIYFAGHGHTIKSSYNEEMGYIVPANSPNPNYDRQGFMATALNMQEIEVYAKKIQSKHALFLFDACFSGSIFSLTRAIPENITYKTTKPVRQFITSGSAEETVPDKSIFRDEFASALKGEADMNNDGYITGSELGEFLQEKVVNYSHGSQHPQYGKIRNPNLDKGDFVFITNPGLADNEENNNNSAKTNPTENTKSISGESNFVPNNNIGTIKDINSDIGKLYLMFTFGYSYNTFPPDTKDRIDYLAGFTGTSRIPLSFEIGAYLSVTEHIIVGPVFSYTFESMKGNDLYDSAQRTIDFKFSTIQFGGSFQYYPLSEIAQGVFIRGDISGAFGSLSESGIET